MHDDISQLREFYASPLGQLARRIIARRIRARWANVTGMDIVGLGYASPYMRMFHGEARATAALMPEEQGVIPWPREGPYRSALTSETRLPLRDMSAECVLAVHSLEHVNARGAYLREIWRVLMPQGRLIIVLPNRRGPWARLDTTPFGHGRPYSPRQIDKALTQALFTSINMTPCLFIPPLRFRVIGPAALAWERVGSRLWPAFSGVIVVEAVKQVYAPIRPRKQPAFAPLPVLQGIGARFTNTNAPSTTFG